MIPPAIRQGVKRGRKGSRRTDVKLSLQCQREPTAPRHKITKILVQDSADLGRLEQERLEQEKLEQERLEQENLELAHNHRK